MKIVSVVFKLFFISTIIINAQVPFTLSNSIIFIPSAKSILSNSENYYVQGLNNTSNTINLYYQSSRMGFQELATVGIGAGFKIDENYQVYFGIGHFGFELMNELNITSAFSINTDNLELGISGQLNRAYIKNFLAENLLTVDIFGRVYFEDFSIGFVLSNLNQAGYANFENTVTQKAIFSVGYDITKQFSADLGTIILINSKSSVFFSGKYTPMDKFAINFKYLFKLDKTNIGLLLKPLKWLNLNIYFTHQQPFGNDYLLLNQIDW